MHVDIDRIILGCGNFGGIGSLPELFGQGEDEEQAGRLLDAAFEAGIRAFDTAHSYGGGKSEEFLGRWLRSLSAEDRGSIRVTTKIGNPFATLPGKRPLEASEIARQVERSLARLGISRLEVLYLHENDPATSMRETMRALETELTKGSCRYVGLSNVKREDVQAALACIDDSLRPRLRFVQNEFHFLEDHDSAELIPFLRKRGILYASFSPLAGGLLSGKYQINMPPPAGSRVALRPAPYQRFLCEKTFAKIDQLTQRAKEKGRSLPEEALSFVLSEGKADFAVIGARSPSHLRSLGLLHRAQQGSAGRHAHV